MVRKPSQALVGRRIKLIVCHDVFSSVRPETEGTVLSIDDNGTVNVKFDGSRDPIGLVWEAGDRWVICKINK